MNKVFHNIRTKDTITTHIWVSNMALEGLQRGPTKESKIIYDLTWIKVMRKRQTSLSKKPYMKRRSPKSVTIWRRRGGLPSFPSLRKRCFPLFRAIQDSRNAIFSNVLMPPSSGICKQNFTLILISNYTAARVLIIEYFLQTERTGIESDRFPKCLFGSSSVSQLFTEPHNSHATQSINRRICNS